MAAALVAVTLVAGVAIGLLGSRVLAREECVATVKTGGTTTKHLGYGRSAMPYEVAITNRVAGHKVKGVCVPN